MASKRRNMFHKNKTQETTEEGRSKRSSLPREHPTEGGGTVPVPDEINECLVPLFGSQRLVNIFLAEADQSSDEEEYGIWKRMGKTADGADSPKLSGQPQTNTIMKYLKKTLRTPTSASPVAMKIEGSSPVQHEPSTNSELKEVSFSEMSGGSRAESSAESANEEPSPPPKPPSGKSQKDQASLPWQRQDWFLQLKESYSKNCFDRVLRDGKPRKGLLFSEDISDSDEIYIIQCPKEMDPHSLVGVDINLSEENRICVSSRDKRSTEVYDLFPQTECKKEDVNLILPSREKGKFVLVSHPLAGNILVSESCDVGDISYNIPQEDQSVPSPLALTDDEVPIGSSTQMNITAALNAQTPDVSISSKKKKSKKESFEKSCSLEESGREKKKKKKRKKELDEDISLCHNFVNDYNLSDCDHNHGLSSVKKKKKKKKKSSDEFPDTSFEEHLNESDNEGEGIKKRKRKRESGENQFAWLALWVVCLTAILKGDKAQSLIKFNGQIVFRPLWYLVCYQCTVTLTCRIRIFTYMLLPSCRHLCGGFDRFCFPGVEDRSFGLNENESCAESGGHKKKRRKYESEIEDKSFGGTDNEIHSSGKKKKKHKHENVEGVTLCEQEDGCFVEERKKKVKIENVNIFIPQSLLLKSNSAGPDGVVVRIPDYHAIGPGFDSLRTLSPDYPVLVESQVGLWTHGCLVYLCDTPLDDRLYDYVTVRKKKKKDKYDNS
ncbi:hypothetical protein AAG570_005257 [Ranatra chinensis]|uniref:Uncharacterized protein n=1 Tax=Ranatra chinensis TaxID=642074 RepID=A0ABD0Y2E2_9HEMI